jgi:DNA mismatch repair protein MutL
MTLARPQYIPKIRQLDSLLINQLNAGEVVERPASVLKELIENSFDAGASRIDILLERGGLESLTVVDDGCGMNPADLVLCLERHTTSKLKEAADLESISTFGFRGEALASIASVASVEIRSRSSETASAFLIKSGAGSISPLEPIAGPIGTSVKVSGLFCQVPARLKYMRSSATELSHCTRLIRELALGNPSVVFSVMHQGRQIAAFRNTSLKERFSECFRVDWKPRCIEASVPDMSVKALLSPPTLQQDRGDLSLFLNGRTIKNRNISAAIRKAYEDVFGPRHEPSGAVYLDIRHDWVDVNVHPQKWEVRCLQQERLFPWLLSSLKKNLLSDISAHDQTQRTSSVPFSLPDLNAREELRFVSHLPNELLLFQSPDELLVANASRLASTLLLRKWNRLEGERSRPLSVPLVFPWTWNNEQTQEWQNLLRNSGFETEIFGDKEAVLKTVPSLFGERDASQSLFLTLAYFRGTEAPSQEAFKSSFTHFLGSAATEMLTGTWLSELASVPRESTACDGRPVFFRISFDSLNKHFKSL